jgi:hypothetical protein
VQSPLTAKAKIDHLSIRSEFLAATNIGFAYSWVFFFYTLKPLLFTVMPHKLDGATAWNYAIYVIL